MKRKSLLVLSRYSRLGASSRLRTMQYLPYLEDAGLVVRYSNLFDDHYIRSLYAGRRTKFGSLRYLGRRVSQLINSSGADVIWLEKEALPWVPWLVERTLMPRGVRVVADYDDAVFHNYDHHKTKIVRFALGTKIDNVMASSAIVFAGNEYLEARARASGAKDVRVIPTVVNSDAYSCSAKVRKSTNVQIGWIGTPTTWKQHGAPLLDTLREVVGANKATFCAIGAGTPDCNIEGFQYPAWSEKTEVSKIQDLDVGIMPLKDTPFSRGKCGYKLIQYMACGLPVIASPIGVNNKIVEHGVNGFLVSSGEEWRTALVALISNPELRRKMGEAGRKKVEDEYSLQVFGPKVAGILSAV